MFLQMKKIMPRFSILNPRYTMILPHYQMVSGIYDIFNHICEQYFSGEDDKKRNIHNDRWLQET